MADDAVEEFNRLISSSSTGEVDDPVAAFNNLLNGGEAAPQHGMLAGMAHQALAGATLNLSENFVPEATRRANKRFAKEHPIASFAGQAAGFAAPMFTPAGWVARTPTAIAKIAEWALPWANFTKAADLGAGAKTILHESGKGAVKTGAWMRGLEPPEGQQKTGDPATDALLNISARGQAAGDLQKMALDYGLGAPAGWVGNKVGGAIGSRLEGIGQASSIGSRPQRGALLDIAHEIKHDNPAGVQATADAIRNLIYGEGNQLGRMGGGNIPPPAQREMARQFHRLTAVEGYTDAQAEQILARYWNARAQGAQRAVVSPAGMGPARPADAWTLRNGTPFAPDTMGGWGRRAGELYRQRNEVPSNLTELVAMASGGEAPALQTTLKKLLNLKTEGPNRSAMLRDLRDRQKAVGPQMESVLRRLANGEDVSTVIAQHVANAENANALYPAIYQSLGKIHDAGPRLQTALRPVIEDIQKQLGNERDTISRTLLTEAEKFLNPREVMGAGSEVPLTSTITKSVKDAAGRVIRKEQSVVPMKRITAHGDEVTTKLNEGGKTVEWEPSGDLESILRRRKALGDEIEKARRGGARDLARELTMLKENVSGALRGLANNADEFGRTMGKWAAANDTRAMAGTLERTYKDFLGLNLTAKKGEALVDLERALVRFRNLDEPNKDMARRAIFNQFQALLEGKGDLHDAAKMFTNPRVRRVLTEMIGDEAVAEFSNFVSRAGLATNTFNMNKGSQTASILDADKHSGWLSSIAGALWHGNPVHAIGKLGEMAGDTLKRKKHDEMLRVLRPTTQDPAELERVLELIAKATRPNPYTAGAEQAGRRAGTAVGGYAASSRP